MIGAWLRRARQVAGDPTLRRWLAGRALGHHGGEPVFTAHHPPYLDGLLPLAAETPHHGFATLAAAAPTASITLPLPGLTVVLAPGEAAALFERAFDDTETLLAIHRFAWLPLLGERADPAWVAALWQAWRQRFGTPGEGWAWHPYTAAERATNLLDVARRHGLPGPADDTAAVLAAHAPAIADRLEYFGDHHTSNHLANNGRGLFRLGLDLGLAKAAEIGGRILLEEAKRIFSPSGVLREGSSHYHLLLTRNYADAWLAARTHGRPEAGSLQRTVVQALAVVPRLVLPGGLPLIGDISPDSPPDFLSGFSPGGDMERGWGGLLPAAERAALAALRDSAKAVAHKALAPDGWLRFDAGPWAGLWHAPVAGWSFMPGHGHQDIGAAELHANGRPVFVDPGRGAYGETGEAALYRSALVHSTLAINGQDPYPANRPYYADTFRRATGGPPPILEADGDTVRLTHQGYARLSGVGAVTRRWRFAGRRLTISDRVEGDGYCHLSRTLATPLGVTLDGEAARLSGDGLTLSLSADVPLRAEPLTRWLAYGEGRPATLIVGAKLVRLPWSGSITVDIVEGVL